MTPSRIPFYPRHWRLLALASVGVAAYAGTLYVPPVWGKVQALREETRNLETRTVASPDLSRRWAQLRARQTRLLPTDSGEAAALVRLQDAANAWGLRLVDLRPSAALGEDPPERGRRWDVVAQGPYAAAAGFLGAMEQPGTGAEVERFDLASPDTLGPSLRLGVTLRLLP